MKLIKTGDTYISAEKIEKLCVEGLAGENGARLFSVVAYVRRTEPTKDRVPNFERYYLHTFNSDEGAKAFLSWLAPKLGDVVCFERFEAEKRLLSVLSTMRGHGE